MNGYFMTLIKLMTGHFNSYPGFVNVQLGLQINLITIIQVVNVRVGTRKIEGDGEVTIYCLNPSIGRILPRYKSQVRGIQPYLSNLLKLRSWTYKQTPDCQRVSDKPCYLWKRKQMDPPRGWVCENIAFPAP